MISRRVLPFAALLAACSMTLVAQDAKEPRKSPHETITATLEGKPITISYGRPYLKGRKAVGGTLVPYGQVWRLGADEATKLTTPVNLDIGGLAVPAGSYALFTIATKDGWTLLINKTPDQWGAFSYDKGQDLGGVPMKVSSTPSTVEQFTMALDKHGDHGATLSLMWENTKASVDITAK